MWQIDTGIKIVTHSKTSFSKLIKVDISVTYDSCIAKLMGNKRILTVTVIVDNKNIKIWKKICLKIKTDLNLIKNYVTSTLMLQKIILKS